MLLQNVPSDAMNAIFEDFAKLAVSCGKAVGGHDDVRRARRSITWTLAARNMDASVSGAYIQTRYETPMTVILNPMSTQRGIQLSAPSVLHSRVEACGGPERPLPSILLGTAIMTGCVPSERWLRQQTLRACQDNSA